MQRPLAPRRLEDRQLFSAYFFQCLNFALLASNRAQLLFGTGKYFSIEFLNFAEISEIAIFIVCSFVWAANCARTRFGSGP
jgi:hypothetical protein